MNQSVRKSVSSGAMTISQSTQRPLDALLGDVTLPGHRLMVQHWFDLYAAAGHRAPFWRNLDPLQFPSALADIWIVAGTRPGCQPGRLTAPPSAP